MRVETLRAGVALDEQHRPTIVVAADKVTIGSHEHDTLDLSSPDAVADAGGVVLGDVADEVLDRLGPAGDAVRALLGLDHPAGHPEVPTLDIGRFLQDPLGAVAEHWQTVVRDHPVAIPALLETLRDLMADAAGAAVDVEGTGAKDDPWRIVLAEPVDLEAWVEGETLTFGPAARLLVDTLGHGCTRIDTVVRVNAVALDLAGRHATFLPGIEATVQLRATDRPQAALITGRMAITADHIGFAARWSPGGRGGRRLRGAGAGDRPRRRTAAGAPARHRRRREREPRRRRLDRRSSGCSAPSRPRPARRSWRSWPRRWAGRLGCVLRTARRTCGSPSSSPTPAPSSSAGSARWPSATPSCCTRR